MDIRRRVVPCECGIAPQCPCVVLVVRVSVSCSGRASRRPWGSVSSCSGRRPRRPCSLCSCLLPPACWLRVFLYCSTVPLFNCSRPKGVPLPTACWLRVFLYCSTVPLFNCSRPKGVPLPTGYCLSLSSVSCLLSPCFPTASPRLLPSCAFSCFSRPSFRLLTPVFCLLSPPPVPRCPRLSSCESITYGLPRRGSQPTLFRYSEQIFPFCT